jgi:predicted nucleic acid-binding protein
VTSFVVDANVAIKWVLTEIYTDNASRLLSNGYTLFVPDFFFSEIGNILWKQVRFKLLTPEEAQWSYHQIVITPLQIYQSQLLVPLGLDIAIRTQQAVYDCVYLALAVQQKCQMVTADERFFNSLRSDSLASYLCWVENII